MTYGGAQLGIKLVKEADLHGGTDKAVGLGATIINLALNLPDGMPCTGSQSGTDVSDPYDGVLLAWGIADTSLTQAVDARGNSMSGKAILLGPARLVNVRRTSELRPYSYLQHSCRPNLTMLRLEPRTPFSDWCATVRLQCRGNKIVPGGSELFWSYGDGYCEFFTDRKRSQAENIGSWIRLVSCASIYRTDWI